MTDKKKIEELNILENRLQQIISTKQAVQIELNEIENAFAELKKTDGEVYKITSGLMIRNSKDHVQKDITERKNFLNKQIEALEKQEKVLEKGLIKRRKEILNNGRE